ncbi:hypothetical protein [Devosia sp.]|uniref:hypothetical protein n=1 Tax=Devosia sp. TaxID=1871048 RepID=UPI003F705849
MDARLGSGLSVLVWIVGWVVVYQFGGLTAGFALSFVQAIWLSMVYLRIVQLEGAEENRLNEDTVSNSTMAPAERTREAEIQLEHSETFLRGLLVPDAERQEKISEMRRIIQHMQGARRRDN